MSYKVNIIDLPEITLKCEPSLASDIINKLNEYYNLKVASYEILEYDDWISILLGDNREIVIYNRDRNEVTNYYTKEICIYNKFIYDIAISQLDKDIINLCKFNVVY